VTFLRPARQADREELARFECARPERQFEIDVQEFVRDAFSWLEDPEGVDREVLVLEDAGETFAACSARARSRCATTTRISACDSDRARW